MAVNGTTDVSRDRRRAPPPPPDIFEFPGAGALGSEMCAADDIILRGRLLPYKPPTPMATTPTTPIPTPPRTSRGPERPPHLKSQSLDSYERSRAGGGAQTRFWKGRGSKSGDYQKLRAVAEPVVKRAGALCEVSSRRPPKWYVFAFGSVRVPAAMDMRDIRCRQRRRSPPAVIGGGAADSVAGVGCNGKTAGGGGGTWKLIRSLSCRGDVDGVVPASLKLGLT